jgi:hypothetical protein
VGVLYQSSGLEIVEIFTDGNEGDPERIGKLRDQDATMALNQVEHMLMALADQHIALVLCVGSHPVRCYAA